jgi:hypothetical protein
MWGAIIRVGARYAFFRRWKNTIIFIGTVLLCAITVFLVDAKMYLSASFIGILAAAAILWLAAHYLRERSEIRKRERRKLEQAAKREAAAEARGERIDKMKTTAAEMVKGTAAGFVDVAKTGFSGARSKLGSWRNKPDKPA